MDGSLLGMTATCSCFALCSRLSRAPWTLPPDPVAFPRAPWTLPRAPGVRLNYRKHTISKKLKTCYTFYPLHLKRTLKLKRKKKTMTLTFDSATNTLTGLNVKACKALLNVTSKEKDFRPAHTCFALVMLPNGLFLTVTNGHVLARVPVNLLGQWTETLTCERPKVEETIKPFKPSAPVELVFSKAEMHFPDVEKVLPTAGEYNVEQVPYLSADYVSAMCELADSLHGGKDSAGLRLRAMRGEFVPVEYEMRHDGQTLGFFIILPMRA